MAKILQGKVISVKMTDTAVVDVTRFVPHPIYKKILRKSKKYKVDTKGVKVEPGQTVKIVETKPISKEKYFKILTQEVKPVKKSAESAVRKERKKKV